MFVCFTKLLYKIKPKSYKITDITFWTTDVSQHDVQTVVQSSLCSITPQKLRVNNIGYVAMRMLDIPMFQVMSQGPFEIERICNVTHG